MNNGNTEHIDVDGWIYLHLIERGIDIAFSSDEEFTEFVSTLLEATELLHEGCC